jgi:hypothetical protein
MKASPVLVPFRAAGRMEASFRARQRVFSTTDRMEVLLEPVLQVQMGTLHHY